MLREFKACLAVAVGVQRLALPMLREFQACLAATAGVQGLPCLFLFYSQGKPWTPIDAGITQGKPWTPIDAGITQGKPCTPIGMGNSQDKPETPDNYFLEVIRQIQRTEIGVSMELSGQFLPAKSIKQLMETGIGILL